MRCGCPQCLGRGQRCVLRVLPGLLPAGMPLRQHRPEQDIHPSPGFLIGLQAVFQQGQHRLCQRHRIPAGPVVESFEIVQPVIVGINVVQPVVFQQLFMQAVCALGKGLLRDPIGRDRGHRIKYIGIGDGMPLRTAAARQTRRQQGGEQQTQQSLAHVVLSLMLCSLFGGFDDVLP